MRVLFVLAVFFFGMFLLTLYYDTTEYSWVFGAGFGVSLVAAKTAYLFKRRRRRRKVRTKKIVKGTHVHDYSLLMRAGRSLTHKKPFNRLFDWELEQITEKAPYTGHVRDERHLVVQSATAMLVLLAGGACAAAVMSVMLGTALPMVFVPLPLLVPLIVPVTLDAGKSNRAQQTSSELLAFLTYCTILHSVPKTLFWTFESVLHSHMFEQIKHDANIVMRYAKSAGEEEGNSIIHMAKFHPHKVFREFMQKYVAFMGTNPDGMAGHVEGARKSAMKATIEKINGYTNSSGTVFFMGTIGVCIIPIMITIMSFIPNSSVDASSLLSIVFIVPLIFIVMPYFMSTGSIFLRSESTFYFLSPGFGIAAGLPVFFLLPDMPFLAMACMVTVAAGVNWLKSKKAEDEGNAADMELPEMLSYVAEQKKATSNMIDIFREYSTLDTTPAVMKRLVKGVVSDIYVTDTFKAFYGNRQFPTRTVRFAFFILYSIYEFGGGSYKTMVDMHHSMRRVIEIKTDFLSATRTSALLMVASPVVFTFSVMMISFMTFGSPDNTNIPASVSSNVALLQGVDIRGITDSLKPMALLIGVAGGLGVSKIVNYSFKNTRFLFFSSLAAAGCLAVWDYFFEFMQSVSLV